MAAWTVLISDGNVSAGPAGPFFSLIVLNEHSVTARYPHIMGLASGYNGRSPQRSVATRPPIAGSSARGPKAVLRPLVAVDDDRTPANDRFHRDWRDGE